MAVSPSADAPAPVPAEQSGARRPHRDDVLIAVTGAVGGVLLWWLDLFNNPAAAGANGRFALLPLALMCLAALGRRVAQPWALLLGCLALLGDLLAGSLLATVILFSDLVYAAVLYGSDRLSRRALPFTVVLTTAVTVASLAVLREPAALLIGAVCALVTAFPASTGLLVRHHRRQAATERLRAEQTALLAEMDRVQAVHRERARMARELHDVIAGHLSAIALHATAAQSLDDRAATGQALEVIRANSVQGLAEMRRLIGLLRAGRPEDGTDPDHPDRPGTTPTLSGVPVLVERARAGGAGSGLRFTLQLAPPTAESATGEALPAPVELAAYRLVQESLTNALKHSGPGEVTVALTRREPATDPDGGSLTVAVSNPLGDRRAPAVPGSGAGLVGMAERVALLGGEFSAGPDGDRWLTRAVLPWEPRHPPTKELRIR